MERSGDEDGGRTRSTGASENGSADTGTGGNEGGGIQSRSANAALAWLLVACVAAAAANSAFEGDLLLAGLGAATIAIVLVPVVAHRLPTAMLPWEVLLFATIPLVSESFGILLPRSIATFLVVPALALAVAVEFDAFTSVEMSPGFAVAFVVTSTMATAGAWAVAKWVADLALGTQHLGTLSDAMWTMVAATGTGVVTGAIFAAYLRRVSATRLGFQTGRFRIRSADETTEFPTEATEGRLQLSERDRRLVVRGFQAALVGVIVVGLYQRSVSTVINAAVAIALMELPAVLERNLELPLDFRLTLWLVVPVFLHALGSMGLYAAVGVWDNLTHALSSSLVAAAGYTTVRALDVHYDGVYLPGKFVAAFLLIFTLAFGVFWEILEFAIDGAATMTGTDSVLAQHGLDNTMLDLVFDAVGALVVAVWGSAHLSRVSDTLADRMADRRDSEPEPESGR
jgi:hypothetical protein